MTWKEKPLQVARQKDGIQSKAKGLFCYVVLKPKPLPIILKPNPAPMRALTPLPVTQISFKSELISDTAYKHNPK